MSNTVAHIGQLELGEGSRETASMFAWPWAAVSETAQEEGPALQQQLRTAPNAAAVPGSGVAGAGSAGAREQHRDASESAVARRPGASVGEATEAEVPGGGDGGGTARQASWWGRDSGAAAVAWQRGAQAVRATVRFATGAGSDGSESEEDEAATEKIAGVSGGLSGSVYNTRCRRLAADEEVSDMAVLCGWCDPPGQENL